MRKATLFHIQLVLILVLVSCATPTILPTVLPTGTPTSLLSTPVPKPTHTPTPTPTHLSLPTATKTKAVTPLPSATETLAVATGTSQPVPIRIPATTPTPLPGWRTYINEYLGYQFDYPSSATIRAEGFISLSNDEKIPEGFTFDEYFSYLDKVLPDNLCVNIESNAVYLTISPPGDSTGRFVGPCPGMGIGSGYRFEDSSEVFQVNGRSYTVPGTKLLIESTGEFSSEIYMFNVDGNFRITFIGAPEKGMTPEAYSEQKDIFKKILATLTWTKLPDLTIPGTTCAGKFTQLVPGVWAQVSPGDTPNRVRSGPSKADETIAQIYPGTIVKVIEGPVCGDGLVFWKVEGKGIPGGVGWTAEGDGTEYYLNPYKP